MLDTPKGANPKCALACHDFPGRIGAVAQLGERRVRNAEVRGSIPLGSTSKCRIYLLKVAHCSQKIWGTNRVSAQCQHAER